MNEPRYVRHFRVTFDEADPAGISFFANAYVYAHRAYEEYILSLGLLDFFSSESIVVPFVHSECEHKAPMKPGESLETRVFLEKLGTSSMVFRYVTTGGGVVRSEVRLVSVFVDASTFEKIPIPDGIRSLLQG